MHGKCAIGAKFGISICDLHALLKDKRNVSSECFSVYESSHFCLSSFSLFQEWFVIITREACRDSVGSSTTNIFCFASAIFCKCIFIAMLPTPFILFASIISSFSFCGNGNLNLSQFFARLCFKHKFYLISLSSISIFALTGR